MSLFKFISDAVNNLFKRFNFRRKFYIVIDKCKRCIIYNLFYSVHHNIKTRHSPFGENRFFLRNFFCGTDNIHCVVADSLEITYTVQNSLNTFTVVFRKIFLT